MVLNFLGRDSGFGNEHTSAFFLTESNDMVIIDCPISTFQKLRKRDLSNHNNIYILITHTHGDHIGGLGLFVQHVFFNLHKVVTIVAPSRNVAFDIITLLTIEGNQKDWYQLISYNEISAKSWFGLPILTEHAPELKGKCFGYMLIISKKVIIYTGDTSTLEPFKPFLEICNELYIDTSVHYGSIHLKLEDSLENLIEFTHAGTKVFLMHLDDADAAEKIIADYPGIEVVTVS